MGKYLIIIPLLLAQSISWAACQSFSFRRASLGTNASYYVCDTSGEFPGGVEGDLAYSKNNSKFWRKTSSSWSEVGEVIAETDPQVGTLTNGKWCTTNGTSVNCTSDTPGGSGDVVGPVSSTNNNVVFFDGVTGMTLVVEKIA